MVLNSGQKLVDLQGQTKRWFLGACVPDVSSRGRQQIGSYFFERGEETYVILLSLEFLTQVKLLSLQRHQPLPHLVGLLPASRVVESRPPLRLHVPAKQLSEWMRKLEVVTTYFSLSSPMWSTLRGFLRSARIFFFFSRSVCFLAPLLFSLCIRQKQK